MQAVSRFRSLAVQGQALRLILFVVAVAAALFLDAWLVSSLVALFVNLYFQGISAFVHAVPDVPPASWYLSHPFQVSVAFARFLFGRPLSAPQVFYGWVFVNVVAVLVVAAVRSGAFGNKRLLSPDTPGGTARFADPAELKDYLSFRYSPGVIFGRTNSLGVRPVILKPSAPGNRNVAVFGPPGSMKSAGYIRNNLFQAVRSLWSVIVTDPKGELVRDFRSWFEKKGYVVKVFNLVSMLNSDRWNPLSEVVDDISAQNFVNIVIANTAVPGRKGGDPFWDRAEMNLLKALVLYVVHELPPNNRNLGSLYQLLACGDSNELDKVFVGLPYNHPAKLPYNLFLETSGTVRSGVIIGLGTRLEVFQNRLVCELTAESDIDLELPGKEKCAYFCVLPDTDSTFNFLASLFFSFLFIKLTRYADRQKEGVLPVPVNFLLDEFCNIPPIPDFEKKVSTMRGRGIACSIIFQNIPQLMQVYGNNTWEVILGDCDYWLVLGAKEKATAGYVSEIIGRTTVEKVSDSRPKGLEGKINPWLGKVSVSPDARPLMDLSEVTRLGQDECILRVADGRIVKIKKMLYTLHPWAKELHPVHVESYLPEWAERYLEREGRLVSKREPAPAPVSVQVIAQDQGPQQEKPSNGRKKTASDGFQQGSFWS
ncbi:MAG: VirD4-like conjugal transfer protein, CD1115 family [Desulfotomaculales bacterium]